MQGESVEYVVEFPLYLVVESCAPSIRCIDVVRHAVSIDGIAYLPVFSDTDLAERFIKEKGIDNGIVVTMVSSEDLLEVIEEIREETAGHEEAIVIDYSEGKKAFTQTFQEVCDNWKGD